MNQIREEIIGLLEPYMDKTLREGCLVQSLSEDRGYLSLFKYDYGIIIESKNDNCFDCKYIGRYGSPVLLNCNTDTNKIIGHYDITAVLKYMLDDRITRNKLDISYSKEHIIFKYKGKDDFIPNKPIYLYTEQEEKNLLEKLKKLDY